MILIFGRREYDGTFTSPTVLEDSSTYDSATHALVVPSASDQYVVTDPTSYGRARNYYSIQSPDGCSIKNCHSDSSHVGVKYGICPSPALKESVADQRLYSYSSTVCTAVSPYAITIQIFALVEYNDEIRAEHNNSCPCLFSCPFLPSPSFCFVLPSY